MDAEKIKGNINIERLVKDFCTLVKVDSVSFHEREMAEEKRIGAPGIVAFWNVDISNCAHNLLRSLCFHDCAGKTGRAG